MNICLVLLSANPIPAYDEIASHLRRQGHHIWIARLDPEGNLLWENGSGRLLWQQGPASVPPFASENPILRKLWHYVTHLAYIRRIRQMVSLLQPDVAQVNTAGLRFTSLVPLGFRRDTAFILHFGQIGDPKRPNTLFLRIRNKIRFITRRFSTAYGFDNALFDYPLGAQYCLGKNWKRWGTFIPMAVDDAFLDLDASDTKAISEEEVVRFIYVGSIARVRRLEVFFSAIRILADKSSAFQVDLLGLDKSDGFYLRLVAELELENYVRFLAPIPYVDVPRRLAEYDVGIAYVPDEPTDWSQYPTLKVLEYRALGLPIIASDLPPNRDFVTSGFNGLLAVNTPAELAGTMLRFVEDRQYLEQTKMNAQQSRSGVRWPEVANMYERVYAMVLSTRWAEG